MRRAASPRRAGLLAAAAALLLGACAPAARPDAGPPVRPEVTVPDPDAGEADAPAVAAPERGTPERDPDAEAAPVVPAAPGEVERVAWLAWLEMEAARLRTGGYATEALLDLALPSGVRWTVTRIAPDAYALRVERDGRPTAYRVTPAGVAPFEVPGN